MSGAPNGGAAPCHHFLVGERRAALPQSFTQQLADDRPVHRLVIFSGDEHADDLVSLRDDDRSTTRFGGREVVVEPFPELGRGYSLLDLCVYHRHSQVRTLPPAATAPAPRSGSGRGRGRRRSRRTTAAWPAGTPNSAPGSRAPGGTATSAPAAP